VDKIGVNYEETESDNKQSGIIILLLLQHMLVVLIKKNPLN